MVVIFGFGPGKAEDLGEVAPIVCPNCPNEVFLHHIRSKKTISLYFIPVVPYGTDEYLICPICTHGSALSKAQIPAVMAMAGSTAAYRRGQRREDFYRHEVDQFWPRMGFAGPSMPPPAFSPSGASAASGPAGAVSTAPPTLGTPSVTAATPPSAGVASPPAVLSDRFEALARLHANGVLTDAEFAAAKERILGR